MTGTDWPPEWPEEDAAAPYRPGYYDCRCCGCPPGDAANCGCCQTGECECGRNSTMFDTPPMKLTDPLPVPDWGTSVPSEAGTGSENLPPWDGDDGHGDDL